MRRRKPIEKRIVNPTLRVITSALMALAFWFSSAGIAAAHTALASSDPAKDAEVAAPPTAIVLTFTENINPAFVSVVVKGTDGRDWLSGPPRVDGSRVTAAVNRPGNGPYTVGYRVVSADGHPVSGSYVFTVNGPSSDPDPASASEQAAPTAIAAPAQPADEGSDTTSSILKAGVAGLALGGVIALWQAWRRRRKNSAYGDPPS